MLLSACILSSLIDPCRPPVPTRRRVIVLVRGIAAESTVGRRDRTAVNLRAPKCLDALTFFDRNDGFFPITGHALALSNPPQLSIDRRDIYLGDIDFE